jgi:hypothetical protein
LGQNRPAEVQVWPFQAYRELRKGNKHEESLVSGYTNIPFSQTVARPPLALPPPPARGREEEEHHGYYME